ncbi:uncharacterized protein LOC143485863 isoform X2 [Brachyhypopomus gauderio]|uniref:uncharacterized protein LOC143485863 isoform X2 n=1 Tax=Brachyhypopomus gauderio TaxID=698409 RepID=UPI004042DAAF
MYLVVKFLCDDTVNIVPSTWYADGKTWWPNYPSDDKINKAVRLLEPPGHDWQQYEARILCHKADYLEARKKLREALYCQTSDLQSEAADDCVSGKKRLRKANYRYFDSESDEDEPCLNKRPRPLPPPVARPPSDCTTPVPPEYNMRRSTATPRADPMSVIAPPPSCLSGRVS